MQRRYPGCAFPGRLGTNRRWPVGAAPPNPGLSMGLLVTIFRDRRTLLLSFGVAGGFGAFLGLSSWLPTYYQQEWGWTLERAGQVVAIPSFFGIVGSLTGSVLSMRLGRRKPFIIVAGLLMPIAVFGSFASESPLTLYPSLALLGFGSWLHLPSVLTMPMEFRGVTLERATLSVAMLLTLGNITGFLSPLMIGYLRDQTGSFELGLTICAALPLTLIIAGLLLPETGPRGQQ